jgi:hypothetical protein
MTNFTIDTAYLTSVTVRNEHKPKFENTEDGLIEALKYTNNCYSISSVDHPEFAKLREQLGAEGYIYIERNWWNGDYVIKPFTLNGKQFKKGNQFCCACAIQYTLEH